MPAPRRVELAEILAEHGLLLEWVQERLQNALECMESEGMWARRGYLALAQLVVLPHEAREEIRNAGVVCEHQARNPVCVGQIRRST